jgi:histone acetyltransferase MYST4
MSPSPYCVYCCYSYDLVNPTCSTTTCPRPSGGISICKTTRIRYANPPTGSTGPICNHRSQTPFQSHQSIGQALGPQHINVQGSSYSRQPPEGYRISQSQSPPTHGSSSHGTTALTFAPVNGQSTSSMKRKQTDNILTGHVSKRRREVEEPVDPYEDASGAGAKHWTDDEKTQLFQWLMGPAHDDHWNSLRATKNSCLREVRNCARSLVYFHR